MRNRITTKIPSEICKKKKKQIRMYTNFILPNKNKKVIFEKIKLKRNGD